ncbi:MAG: IPTL-CTERM sorting domain-containing protein [Thermoanaerobaculia bacterium]|nr:IPTL-CTERM sorting domain-containing protein [Thermoanaerobaculia bacterium]
MEPRGQLTLPGPSIYETGLAFDATGRLWLTTEGRLYEVDPTDGALRQQADLGREVPGLAGCGSTLFGITRPAGLDFPVQVLRIDPATGAVTELGSGNGPDVFMSDGGGLDFDSEGRLWGVLHNPSGIGLPVFLDFIVEFDPITGEVLQSTHLHELGRGLAIGPPPAVCPGRGVTEVPTLGEWGLVLLAGLLGGGACWRLRRAGVRPA